MFSDIFSDQYVGCYQSGGSKDSGFDKYQQLSTGTNSITSCVNHCRSEGFTFAGVQVKLSAFPP